MENTNFIEYETPDPLMSLTKAHPNDVCYDITALVKGNAVCILPKRWHIFHTGIYLKLPPNIEGQICSRSGLAATHGIIVMNSPGIIDPEYSGEIRVILLNLGKKKYFVKNGERIAQLKLNTCERIELRKVNTKESVTINPESRKTNGLGSSGSF